MAFAATLFRTVSFPAEQSRLAALTFVRDRLEWFDADGFPKGFGYDPTVMGERKPGYIAGRRRPPTSFRTSARQAALPVVLVAGELLPLDPREPAETAPPPQLPQSPFLTTALVGFLLAGAGYFVGIH